MSDPVPRIRVPLYESQLSQALQSIRSGHLAQGPHLDELAERLCALFHRRFAILTSNGFSALFASLKALDLPPGSAVATGAVGTCFSIVNAIRAAGLTVDFVDLEPSSLSMVDPGGSERSGRVAIVPDHFGRIADLALAGAGSNDCYIEDAAQSFISRTRVQTQARLLVLSFYPTKLVNGIDGGAVLTDDPELHGRLSRLVSYADQMEPEQEVRYNFRMNNLHAAFALGTLENLGDITQRLESNFAALARVVAAHGLRLVEPAAGEVPSRMILKCQSREERDCLVAGLRRRGVAASEELIWLCQEDERAYYPIAAELVDCTCSLPFYPDLSSGEIDAIAGALEASA